MNLNITKPLYAAIAENPFMESPAENIAITSVISQKGLVKIVSEQLFEQEKMYQTSMHIFRSMLTTGIITEADYKEAERIMQEKYNPTVGALFSDLALT